MWSVVAQLYQAGYLLGILSNTCDGHWNHCLSRYHLLRAFFTVHALSYETGSLKPDTAIFLRAAKLAGCRPEEIFTPMISPGM
jgi:FMN phosphatase YigB (HAD superfamily)